MDNNNNNSILSLSQEIPADVVRLIAALAANVEKYTCKIINCGSFYEFLIEKKGGMFDIKFSIRFQDTAFYIDYSMGLYIETRELGNNYCKIEIAEPLYKLLITNLLLFIYERNRYDEKNVDIKICEQIDKDIKPSAIFHRIHVTRINIDQLRDFYAEARRECEAKKIFLKQQKNAAEYELVKY